MIPIWTSSVANKLLDQYQKLINLSALAAIIIILADAAAEKDVGFFGLKMATDNAYSIAAVAFTVTVFMLSQLSMRLTTIVKSADPTESPKVLAVLFNHQWSFNPFSYLGKTALMKFNAALGAGFVVFVWWLGLLAITQLWHRRSMPAGGWESGLWIAYIAAGIVALGSIIVVHVSIVKKLERMAPVEDSEIEFAELKGTLLQVFAFRLAFVILFSFLGYWFFYSLTHIGA